MKSDYVVDKLISGMGRLSDRELRNLADLFKQGNTAQVFAEVIENTIRLRRMERERHNREYSDEMHIDGRSRERERAFANEPARERFFAFLNERSLFPSTRDVVEVLNDVFELELCYEDYRKRGRRDMIRKAWHHFEGMEFRKRRRVLRVLSGRSAQSPHLSEGYHELFRILSQK